jgi:hypothetical protein
MDSQIPYLIPGVEGQDVKKTALLYLVLRVRIRGVIPSLPTFPDDAMLN